MAFDYDKCACGRDKSIYWQDCAACHIDVAATAASAMRSLNGYEASVVIDNLLVKPCDDAAADSSALRVLARTLRERARIFDAQAASLDDMRECSTAVG